MFHYQELLESEVFFQIKITFFILNLTLKLSEQCKAVLLFCSHEQDCVIYAAEKVCKFYNRIKNVWVSLGNVNKTL